MSSRFSRLLLFFALILSTGNVYGHWQGKPEVPPKVVPAVTPPTVPVQAKIEGLTEVKPNTFFILDASKSVGAESYSWACLNGDSFYTDTNGMTIVGTAQEGKSLTFLLAVAGKDKDGKVSISTAIHTITMGKLIPPVPPVPPTPPVVSGLRTVLIFRESADATTKTRDMIVSLRAGAQASYLKSKGHTLVIMDKDTLDATGKSALEKWLPLLSGTPLPALVVYDPVSKTIVDKETIPDTDKQADFVIEAVKKTGG